MSRQFSVYLDLVRLIAAFTVLLSHFAYARFTDGDYLIIRELNLGSDAVVVFFVLSGFVIAFAAEQKDKSANIFFFNRITRLLSVALPALFLTFICDRIGSTVAPDAYSDWWYNPMPALYFFLQGVTFSNEWTLMATRLGTNGPYWSLSYEFAYYVLFGIAFFLRGASRVILFVCFCVLFGINILLLGPAWLLGVFVYHSIRWNTKIPRFILIFCAIIPFVIYAFFLMLKIPTAFIDITKTAFGNDIYLSLRFSNEFIWNLLTAVFFAVHLFAMAMLLKSNESVMPFSKLIRWLAGASFSIYLVHYPVLQLLSSILPKLQFQMANHLILFFLTLFACFLFAQLFERRLYEFRTTIGSYLRIEKTEPA